MPVIDAIAAPDLRVRIKREQNRLGSPKYPGRVGTVGRRNMIGGENGGLWYVDLDATRRAKAHTEMFWGTELEPLLEETL